MGLNNVASAERIHIGIFGSRNAGKSSIINAITNQNIAIVSDTPGTTTDPVKKAMELLPLGPVVIIDTPGIDDMGELGEMRVKKARQVLNYTDIAILVIDVTVGLSEKDEMLVNLFKEKNIPTVYELLEKHKDGRTVLIFKSRAEADEFILTQHGGKNAHS